MIKKIILFILILILLIIYSINKEQFFTNKNINHKNFVFTSCGNNTIFHELWCGKNANYDIYAIYYGDDNEKYNLYKKKVNFIEKRKGSKFQNFHYFYNKYPEIINKYERFFILDDDIIFDVNDINKMFSISKKYNLWICSPTFKNNGTSKISHQITIQRPNNLLRYVNFIEVGIPLFNKKALDKCMKYYDPILIGWGIDYLYIWANGLEHKNKYALIDSIGCINPHDNKKNNNREHNNIKNFDKEHLYWINIKKKYSINEWKHTIYSNII
jgi:hypothetical protein